MNFAFSCVDFFNSNYSKKRAFSEKGIVGGIAKICRFGNSKARKDKLNKKLKKRIAAILEADAGYKNLVSKSDTSEKSDSSSSKNREKVNTQTQKEEKSISMRDSLEDRVEFNWVLHDGLAYYVPVDAYPDYEGRNLEKHGDIYVDSKNSFFLGKHPLRNGVRTQKFFKAPVHFTRFSQKYKKFFEEFDVELEKCVVSKGCWHTNKYTLQRQLIPEQECLFTGPPSKKILLKLQRSVRNVIRKLKIEKIFKRKKKHLLGVSFNKDTYAGFHYENYLKKGVKRDCVLNALELACKRWDVVERGNFSHLSCMPSIYQVGARNKRDYTYDNGDTAGSRVVHMPEFHVELNSGVWIDAITEAIKEKADGPVFIGNSNVRYERFAKVLENSHFQLEGDWKRFDSTLYINIIICATAILRCFYEHEDVEIDNHFLAIFDSVGIKDYYSPGGNVARCMHGLPSGVKCTNLIGTIVNLLALDFCTNRGANRRFSYVAGGDDFVVVCKDPEILDIQEFIDEFTERAQIIGMNFKILQAKDSRSDRLEELPCFYKYVVRKDSPMIPIDSLLERVFMPWNKSYNSEVELMKFLNDIMPSLGRPASHLLIFYLLYAEIFNRIFAGSTKRKRTYVDAARIHSAVYKRMMIRAKSGCIDESQIEGNFTTIYINFKEAARNGRKLPYISNFEEVF